MSDLTDRARELLDRIQGFAHDEWDSYTVPDAPREPGYTAVAIGDHEIKLRWLEGAALVAEFIAATPDLVRALLAEIDRLTPRNVETAAELDALPEYTVIREEGDFGAVLQRIGSSWYAPSWPVGDDSPLLPARVLWTPGDGA